MDPKVLAAVKAAAEAGGGKLSCGKAWALAEEFQVPRKAIGEIANELGIKIKECQLGCF